MTLRARRSSDQPWAPPGTFRAALRELQPERAAQLDAADARAAAARASAEGEQLDLAPSPAAPRAPRPPSTPRATTAERRVLERDVQRAIVRELERRGWKVMRRGVGMVRTAGGDGAFSFGERGEADLEVLPGGGLACFLEVKRPGGRLADHQARWLERRRAAGYVAEVVHSPTEAIAAVERALSQRGTR